MKQKSDSVRPTLAEANLGVQLTKDVLEMLIDKLEIGEVQGDRYQLAITKLDAATELLSQDSHRGVRSSPLDARFAYQTLYYVAMDFGLFTVGKEGCIGITVGEFIIRPPSLPL